MVSNTVTPSVPAWVPKTVRESWDKTSSPPPSNTLRVYFLRVNFVSGEVLLTVFEAVALVLTIVEVSCEA